MTKENLKSLTHAHGWIGVVISLVLFTVFLGGAFSLFREEIVAWEREPFADEIAHTTKANLDQVVANSVKGYELDAHHGFTIRVPQKNNPNYEVYFAEEGPNGEEIDINLLISGETGKPILKADNFTFGDFLYELHFNLHLGNPGLYFVGIITFFFFIALLSGIVIHWRNVSKKFYQYRKDSNKDKWLDGHNMIGVMGLPFHIMYAFTGLIFNLIIIFQIAYALALYGGDQKALLADAGFPENTILYLEQPHSVTGLDDLYSKAKQDLSPAKIEFITIDNFGDKNVFVRFRGENHSEFSTQTEAKYMLATGELVYKTMNNYNNDVRGGLNVLASLHFANFAGYGLKIVFFLLAIGTCYIILTGNLMWLEKQRKQKQTNRTGIRLVKAVTYGGFAGTIFAVALGFLLARLLPSELVDRIHYIEMVFFTALIALLLLAMFIKNLALLARVILRLTSFILLTVIALDWILMSNEVLAVLARGQLDTLTVESILFLFALCCWLMSNKLAVKTSEHITVKSQSNLASA